MTAKRASIFKPIGTELSNQLDAALGGRGQSTAPENPYPAGLENYARLMYPKIVEFDVPTWIIAPPESLDRDSPANILKVHPQREPLCKLNPDQFNEKLDKITANHCRK